MRGQEAATATGLCDDVDEPDGASRLAVSVLVDPRFGGRGKADAAGDAAAFHAVKTTRFPETSPREGVMRVRSPSCGYSAITGDSLNGGDIEYPRKFRIGIWDIFCYCYVTSLRLSFCYVDTLVSGHCR